MALLRIHPPHIAKQKMTQTGHFLFWWETACIVRANNRQEFADLMQRVKEFKERWLISLTGEKFD